MAFKMRGFTAFHKNGETEPTKSPTIAGQELTKVEGGYKIGDDSGYSRAGQIITDPKGFIQMEEYGVPDRDYKVNDKNVITGILNP
jgi:hypothetical protein